jgi:dTDP-4-amino-4,6-dideoxygalactose transaminase
MDAFKYLGYKVGDFPVSEKLSDTIVSLPMHPYLSNKEIDFIISTLLSK